MASRGEKVNRALFVAVGVGIGVYIAQRLYSQSKMRRGNSIARPSKQQSESGSPKTREPGEWEPRRFDYPPIDPCAEDPTKIKPIPYRPFKWGQYHVTMGIRNMRWNEWIELDEQFQQHHKIREERIRERGGLVLKTLPARPGVVASGHPAALELVYELAEFLSRRYPTTYSVTRLPVVEESYGWHGLGQIRDITIIPLNKTYTIGEQDPLLIASMLVQEDLAIMVEGTDGRYYFQAGSVLVAGTWRMQDKLGMPLDEIHLSGGVPQFESKLNMSMARFFKRMPLDKPIVRNNYTFQVVREPKGDAVDPSELAWAQTMKGDEDLIASDGQRWLKGYEEKESVPSPGPTVLKYPVVEPSTVWLRVERQTLRRLPRTGAIVFTIRVYQTRVCDLVKEPGVPGRMASAIRSWPEDVSRYKAHGVFGEIVNYLDECHAEQLKNGLFKEETEYPF